MDHGTVIYFGGFELPDKNAAAQRVISISKSLRDIGYKVFLIGLSKDVTDRDGIVARSSNIIGIEMLERAYPQNIIQWFNHIITCDREIDLIKKTPSVKRVICYNYPAVSLWKLNKYCSKKNITLIADTSEWYAPANKGFFFNIIKNIDTNLRMKHVQARLDNIICISKFLYDYYKTKVPNCVLIPGTIDKMDEKWNQVPRYVPNTPFTLGYTGDPGVKCGKERVDLLISVICELNAAGYPCHLKLAGFEQAAFELEYPELTNKPYYQKCIHFFGRLSHEKCLQLIGSVDFSVIVREDKRVTRAGFPTKLSESLACGTPVIVTPASNITDFIIDGKNGLVTRDFSYNSLVQTVKRALNYNHDELIDMHKYARDNNGLEYKKYTGIIENLLITTAID